MILYMGREELISKIDEIIQDTENTNYGSIKAEFKMIILLQEFVLKNGVEDSREFLVDLLMSKLEEVEDVEAKVQFLGEIYTNLIGAHKNISMLEDNGEDYMKRLFSDLNLLIKGNRLFQECNT